MASPSVILPLLFMSSLGWLSALGSAFFLDYVRMTSSAPSEPHFTKCVSREMETFRCWWSAGSFHNLSSPGALRAFYLKKEYPTSEWKECPEYIHSKKECFFDMNHTSIWVPYCVQLRTQDNITYYNEDDCFTVENIVRPDPPVALNWTLLSMSPSGLHYDVMVHWEPPPSADVKAGWMHLEYQVKYRGRNRTSWEALEVQTSGKQTIYGLHIGEEYEVHIQSAMMAFSKFGEFSESIFIHVKEIPSKESTFPISLVLLFGIVGVVILIILIIFSQQHRLMVILLPLVPEPKIKGIDPELLKKGKLEELNFILSGGGMGGLPSYAQDFYQDEPWVEFIELDVEDPDSGEKEENQGPDTQRLLGLSQPTGHHTHRGCSHALSFPDDSSGRASCYGTDLPDQEPLMLMATLLSGQPEGSEGDDVSGSPAPEGEDRPQTWVNTDFYAQVSDVMPSGGVVLSPGQQLRAQDSASATEEEEEETNKKGTEIGGDKDSEAKKDGKQRNPRFQLLVVDPVGGGRATESGDRQISTPPMPGKGYQTLPPQPAEAAPSQEAFPPPAPAVGEYQSSYILSDSPGSQFLLPPVSDYTVVQEVDCQHSLLLNPPSPQPPPPRVPQHPLKAMPAMPLGYVSPDLLGNLSP
ncbi:growth hormone receptor a [Polymixia lowei]